jgi:hypothetical protein
MRSDPSWYVAIGLLPAGSVAARPLLIPELADNKVWVMTNKITGSASANRIRELRPLIMFLI